VDIALASMALSQGQVQVQASVSMMKEVLGTAEERSEALQQLMSTAQVTSLQHAAQPHLGVNIDLKR